MAAERLEFARLLRSQTNRSEEVLWRSLRGSRFRGAKFRAGSVRPIRGRFHLPRGQARRRPPDCDPGRTAGSMSGSRIPTRSGRKSWRAVRQTDLLSERRRRGRSRFVLGRIVRCSDCLLKDGAIPSVGLRPTPPGLRPGGGFSPSHGEFGVENWVGLSGGNGLSPLVEKGARGRSNRVKSRATIAAGRALVSSARFPPGFSVLRFLGASPSGKAADFDSPYGRSNPSAPSE